MIIIILLIINISALLYLTNLSHNKYSVIIEGYDARYTNTGFPQCAEFCKSHEGCYAFGYDKAKHICYPSQVIIQGEPLDSLYKDEYSYGHAVCNKVKSIENADPKPAFEKRRSNSVYVCVEEAVNKQPQYYFHNKGEFKNIGEGKNIDDIFDVEEYAVQPYKWSRNRFNYDQADLLAKERENMTYTPNNITELNRIINYKPVQEAKPAQIIKKINIKPSLDFNLDKIKIKVI